MAQPALQFFDLSANKSIQRWIELRKARGKDRNSSMRKIMHAWVKAAYYAVKPGDKMKIRTDLMRVTTKNANLKKGRTRGKVADEMRGTLAARLIWALDWKGARSAAPPGGWQTAAFYRLAKKFLRAREFSANLHRAGMFPAFEKLGYPTGMAGPRYKKFPPGMVEEKMLSDAAEILVENWASRKGGAGIAGISGSAFESTLPKVIEMFEAYSTADELAAAKKAGFAITGTFAAKTL